MSTLEAGPLTAMVLLGTLHGANPAMGWLFAVALGLQEKKGRAVWRALPPLALGHALSVAAVVVAGVFAGSLLRSDLLRLATAFVLCTFGMYRLVGRHGHPNLGGMRVSQRDLVLWSFLMATAHGAGLMLLPFIQETEVAAAGALHAAHGHGAHLAQASLLAGQTRGLAAALVHTLSYLLAAAGLAYLVYARLGVRILRTAWINLDLIWSAALILTGLLTAIPVLRGGG